MAEFGIKWHLHKKVYPKVYPKGNLKEKTPRKLLIYKAF
jgi:hypothetical protein